MIITPEQAALKAQHQFDALREFVHQAARDGQRIDTVERELFRQLLGLGHTLLSAFVAAPGDGDLGPEAETPGGRIVRRLPERHGRRYVSIFGELAIDGSPTAPGRARRSSGCRWTSGSACPRGTSPTCWRTGASGSA